MLRPLAEGRSPETMGRAADPRTRSSGRTTRPAPLAFAADTHGAMAVRLAPSARGTRRRPPRDTMVVALSHGGRGERPRSRGLGRRGARAARVGAARRRSARTAQHLLRRSLPRRRDAFALAALLNGPLARAWLDALAEPARGGYRRYLGWTMSLLPVPSDWNAPATSSRRSAKPRASGERRATANLLDASLAAYGVDRRDVAPLVAWARQVTIRCASRRRRSTRHRDDHSPVARRRRTVVDASARSRFARIRRGGRGSSHRDDRRNGGAMLAEPVGSARRTQRSRSRRDSVHARSSSRSPASLRDMWPRRSTQCERRGDAYHARGAEPRRRTPASTPDLVIVDESHRACATRRPDATRVGRALRAVRACCS